MILDDVKITEDRAVHSNMQIFLHQIRYPRLMHYGGYVD